MSQYSQEKPQELGPKYYCMPCGYIYDPAMGDPDDPSGAAAPGTPFADLPDDWLCPICMAPTNMFAALD